MQNGYIDIPADQAVKYSADLKKKEGVCKVMPRARFSFMGDGSIQYAGLVCSSLDMAGDATGIGAGSCKNCIL